MHASFIPMEIMVTLHVHKWKSVMEVNHTVEESNGSGSMRWKSVTWKWSTMKLNQFTLVGFSTWWSVRVLS